MLQRGCIVDDQQQPADRVGRALAIVEEFFEVCITIADDILRKSRQEVGKKLQRKLEFAYDGHELAKPGYRRCKAGFYALQLLAKRIQLPKALFRRHIAFIGDVVRCAGKMVNELDGPAKSGR